jgi:GGDEF domain-containing protein
MADDDPGLTVWAGISVYPAHGFTSTELLDAADIALQQAREWRQDRIEIAHGVS